MNFARTFAVLSFFRAVCGAAGRRRTPAQTMCIVFIHIYDVDGRKKVLLCGNRDEFCARATRQLSFFDEHQIAGKDLERCATRVSLSLALTQSRDRLQRID